MSTDRKARKPFPKPVAVTVALSCLVEAADFNPRTDYGQEDGTFAELVASIQEHGVLQAPLVRANGDGTTYTIIGGHRRVRAARAAGLEEISVSALPYDTQVDDFPLALIENLQRKDLSAIEKARGFKKLIDRGNTPADVARIVGVSSAYVSRVLALLELPKTAQTLMEQEKLSGESGSHLVRLTRAKVPASRITAIARKTVKEKLTGYEVGALVSEELGQPAAKLHVPTELILSVPYSQKGVVDWAIKQYGTLAHALEALHQLHHGAKKKQGSDEGADQLSNPNTIRGTWGDPMAVVRTAQSRKWAETLVGMNANTGALIATPTGPLPPGFMLACTVFLSGVAQVPMTASGKVRTVGERIKDSIEGPRRAGLK